MTSVAVPEKQTGNKRKKKKKTKLYMVLGGFAVVSLVVWAMLQPAQGTIHTGLCRTFVELRLRYPETMETISVEQFGGAYRVFYIYKGAFGEVRSEMIQCRFKPGQNNALILDAVEINRVPVERKEIDIFNATTLDLRPGIGADILQVSSAGRSVEDQALIDYLAGQIEANRGTTSVVDLYWPDLTIPPPPSKSLIDLKRD